MKVDLKQNIKKYCKYIKDKFLDSNWTILIISLLIIGLSFSSRVIGKYLSHQNWWMATHNILASLTQYNALFNFMLIVVGLFAGLIFLIVGITGTSETSNVTQRLLIICYLRPLTGLFFGFAVVSLYKESPTFFSIGSCISIGLFIVAFSRLIQLMSMKNIWKLCKHLKDTLLDSNWTILIISLLIIGLNFISVSIGKNLSHQDWLAAVHGSLAFVIQDNAFLNLILILVGAFVGLIFFIVGVIGASESGDMARVLLRRCYLRPLIGFFFGFTVIVLSRSSLIYSSVTSLIFIALFLVAFSRLILLISNKRSFYKEREKLLIERFNREVGHVIQVMRANDVLLSQLSNKSGDEKILLAYSPIVTVNNKDKYRQFVSAKSGVVEKINEDALQSFAIQLENYANNKGFSFHEDEKIGTPQPDSEHITLNDKIKYKINKNRFLMTLHDNSVNIDEPLIIVDSELISSEEYKILQKILPDIFIVGNVRSSPDELEFEINSLTQEFLVAIKNEELSKVKLFRKTYLKLIDIVLCDEYHANEISYDLYPLKWLYDNVVALVKKSIKSDNIEVIKETIYISVDMAINAIRAKKKYVSTNFIEISNWLYFMVDNQPDESIQNFLIDRAHRYITEAYRFNMSKLDNANEFGLILMQKNFQLLLKRAFEKNDFTSFEKFYNALVYIAPDEKNLIEDEKSELIFQKQEMLFGIASLVVMKVFNNKIANIDNAMRFFNLIQQDFADFNRLTKIYYRALSSELWDWGFWIMEDKPEMKVHVDNFADYLGCCYVLMALSCLPAVSQYEQCIIENEGQIDALIKTSQSMKKDDFWVKLMESQKLDIKKIDTLIETLEKMKIVLEARKMDELKSRALSNEKVEQFQSDLLKGYEKSSIIKKIYAHYGAYRWIDNFSEELKQMELNQIFDKEAFVNDSNIHYADLGVQFGRNVAFGESEYFLELLEKLNLPQITLDEFLKKQKNKPNNHIIFTQNILIWELADVCGNFSANYSDNNIADQIRSDGVYRDGKNEIPVFCFQYMKNTSKKSMYFLEKNRLGIFAKSERDTSMSKEIDVDVIDIRNDSNLKNELIDSRPEWLTKLGDVNEQASYLDTRVCIKIREKINFDFTNLAGYINIIDEGTQES